MKTVHEIVQLLSSHKHRLYDTYAIKTTAIFGSYSRKEQDLGSDLDFLVEFDEKIDIRFVDLAEELENSVGSKVDLVSKNGVKEKYLKSIKPDLIYV